MDPKDTQGVGAPSSTPQNTPPKVPDVQSTIQVPSQTDEDQAKQAQEAAEGELDRALASPDDIPEEMVQKTAAVTPVQTPLSTPQEKKETPVAETTSSVEPATPKPVTPTPQPNIPAATTAPELNQTTEEVSPISAPKTSTGLSTLRTFHGDVAYAQGEQHVVHSFAPTKKEEGTQQNTQAKEEESEDITHDSSIIPPDHVRNIASLKDGRNFDGTGKSLDKLMTPETERLKREREAAAEKSASNQKPPQSALKKKPKKSIVRTYEDDSAKALKDTNASVVSIALAERKRQEEEGEKKKTGRPLWQKTIIGFAVFLLVASGIGLLSYIGYQKIVNPEKAVISQTYSPLIFAENRTEQDATNLSVSELRSLLGSSRTQQRGGVSEIILYTQEETAEDIVYTPLTTEALFGGLGLEIRAPLIRFLGEQFMIGTYQNESKLESFWLFTVNNFEGAFANMLAWERSMYDDIEFFFPEAGAPAENASSTPQEPVWSDLIVENRDTRVLKDSSGTVYLLYAFPFQSALVITSDIESFREIVRRVDRRAFAE